MVERWFCRRNKKQEEIPRNTYGPAVTAEISSAFDELTKGLKVPDGKEVVLNWGGNKIGRKILARHKQRDLDRSLGKARVRYTYTYGYFFEKTEKATNQRTGIESIGDQANLYTEVEEGGVRVKKMLNMDFEDIAGFLAEIPRPINFNSAIRAEETLRVDS